MQSTERIDFIELERKAEELLSIPYEEGLKQTLIDEVSFLLLSSGKEIPCLAETSDLFSPVLILDKIRQVYYPAFFFSPSYTNREGQEYLSLENESPKRNSLCTEFLKGLNLYGSLSFNNLESFVSSLSSLIDSQMLMDKISIRFSFCFCKQNVLLYNSVYSLILSSVREQRKDEKYKGLFSEVREEEKEKILNQDNVGFFSKQERSLVRREQYKASLVSYDEESVLDDYLIRALKFFREKNHSVLLVGPEEEQGFRDLFLNRHHLKDIILNLTGPFSLNERRRLLKDATPISFEGNGYYFSEERLESFEKKRNDCFLLPSFFKSDAMRKYLFSKEVLESRTYPVDAFSYTGNEAEKDFEILGRIQDKKNLLSMDLCSHPFYGLDSDGERPKYDSLCLLLLSMQSSLQSIETILKEELKDYTRPLDTFSQMESLFEERRFVERYDGFSLSMFSLSAQQNSLYPLSNLKKRFQAVSSIKLIVKDFFDDSVFQSDIQNRIDLERSPSYFERRKGTKRIKGYLKNKNNPDYDALVKILDSYQKNYSRLQQRRPLYRKIYGENRTTRSYVTESETRRNYVHEFEEREKKDPFFSFSNPFVHRLYQDEDYRNSFLSSVRKLNSGLNEFKERWKEYRFYFPKEKNLELFSLSQCLSRIQRRMSGSYPDFKEYSSFHKDRRSASWFLQNVRKEQYLDFHRPLLSFKDEFFHSLCLSYYQEGKKRFSLYQKDYLNFLKENHRLLKEASLDEDYSLISRINDNQIKNQKDVSYRDISLRLTSAKIEDNLTDNKENDINSILPKRYPVRISDSTMLGRIKDDCFDDVILLDSRLFKDVVLLNSIRVGKSILLLSSSSLSDNRIQGLHYSYLSNDGIYRKVLAFDKVPEERIDLFKENQEKYGYQLLLDDPRYPYRIRRNGKEDIGLFPSFLLPSDEDRRGRYELSRYLSKERNFSLFYFRYEELVFDTDFFFRQYFK